MFFCVLTVRQRALVKSLPSLNASQNVKMENRGIQKSSHFFNDHKGQKWLSLIFLQCIHRIKNEAWVCVCIFNTTHLKVSFWHTNGQAMNSRSWMVSATVRRTGDLPQNVAYAVKGKYLLKILEDCGVKSETNDSGNADTDFERMVEKLTGAVVLIQCY